MFAVLPNGQSRCFKSWLYLTEFIFSTYFVRRSRKQHTLTLVLFFFFSSPFIAKRNWRENKSECECWPTVFTFLTWLVYFNLCGNHEEMFTSQPNDFIIIISAHQRVSERKMINPHTHTTTLKSNHSHLQKLNQKTPFHIHSLRAHVCCIAGIVTNGKKRKLIWSIGFIGGSLRRLEVCGFRPFRFDSDLCFFSFYLSFFSLLFFLFSTFSLLFCSSQFSDGIREYFSLGKNRRVCWFLCRVVLCDILYDVIGGAVCDATHNTDSALTVQAGSCLPHNSQFKCFVYFFCFSVAVWTYV